MTAASAASPSGESVCSSCAQPIADTYYEVNGQVVCEDCRIVAEEQVNLGGGPGQMLRAALLGLLAAAAGFGIYYGVARFTGNEYAIIAAVIGLMVGAAVKRGSNGRGGWRYQTLAIFLTYTAIVASYVPFLFEELQRQAASPVVADSASVPPTAPEQRAGSDSAPAEPAAGAPVAAAPADQATAAEPGQLDIATAVLGVLALVAFVYVVPFLGGLENIIGLVIIGIALFEAWHLNRRATLSITGPHRLAVAGP